MIAITPFLLLPGALVCQGKKEGSLIPHLGLEKHLRVNYDFPHRIKDFFSCNMTFWIFDAFLIPLTAAKGSMGKISPFWHDEHDIKQSWGISFLSFFSEYFCRESACCSGVSDLEPTLNLSPWWERKGGGEKIQHAAKKEEANYEDGFTIIISHKKERKNPPFKPLSSLCAKGDEEEDHMLIDGWKINLAPFYFVYVRSCGNSWCVRKRKKEAPPSFPRI